MPIAKLLVGLASIIFSGYTLYLSVFVSILNAFRGDEATAVGILGFIASVIVLSAGIMSIVCRYDDDNIIEPLMYIVGGIILLSWGEIPDYPILGAISIIFAVIIVIAMVINNRYRQYDYEENQENI